MQKKLREAKGLPADKQQKTALETLWMGREDEDWKEKRLKKEQEVLDKGEGYGTLIMDQLREVWGGQKEGEEKGSLGKTETSGEKSNS